ncbi:MAG: type III-A CRISPR-associated protein Csm2 [Chitinophagaceae bacterium]|nr:type III-A CRISPR-associated protein Csm2 [Chitinophagaceae bacterium]
MANGKHHNFDLNSYKNKIESWIQNGIKDDEPVKFADKFGSILKNGKLTTSQLRNFFGELRRIQMKGYDAEKLAFLMVKPKLAYAVKRHDNDGLLQFYKFFNIAYEVINKNDGKNGAEKFHYFMQLAEAILAYHKFHGGKD